MVGQAEDCCKVICALDKTQIERRLMCLLFQTLRKLFWMITVESPHGLVEVSQFDFKYVPELRKRTLKEDAIRDNAQQADTSRQSSEVKIAKTGALGSGAEGRNLKWLLIGCFHVGLLAWLLIHVSMGVLNRIGTACGPVIHVLVYGGSR